jgi:peptidoglycan/xylan/chitin deacetylase (PgdA/CDA1 family)
MTTVPSSILNSLDTLPRYSLKQKVLKATQPLLYWSGLAPLFARMRSAPSTTILMYHSVPTSDLARWIDPCNSMPPDAFERQMAFLARHRNVISINALVSSLRQGVLLPRGTVAITFDDGYLDNLTVAAPILAKYELPATLYLTTGAIDRAQPQWIDALYTAFSYRSCSALSLEDYGLQTWQLTDSSALRQAYFAIVHKLLKAGAEDRQHLMEVVLNQLAPTQKPPRLLMTWEEVRQLRQQFPNFELGAHTANHIDLGTHSHLAVQEIETSLDRIEAETGYRPRHFAYPYNRYNAAAQSAVKRLNLKSAVATCAEPVVRQQPDFYALPRVEASRSMTLLRLRTSGAFPDLSKRLLGRVWTSAH